VSAARAHEVAAALAVHATERFGGAVRVDGEPSSAGEGMDNEVHFVRLAGEPLPAAWRGPLVVRVQPDADRFEVAQAEAAV
jgi:hypothetical protein